MKKFGIQNSKVVATLVSTSWYLDVDKKESIATDQQLTDIFAKPLDYKKASIYTK